MSIPYTTNQKTRLDRAYSRYARTWKDSDYRALLSLEREIEQERGEDPDFIRGRNYERQQRAISCVNDGDVSTVRHDPR